MKNITKRELHNCTEFMDLVREVAEDRMPDLPYHSDMTAENICGEYFWGLLNPGQQRLVGKGMKRLVKDDVLPLDIVKGIHEYPLLYQRR